MHVVDNTYFYRCNIFFFATGCSTIPPFRHYVSIVELHNKSKVFQRLLLFVHHRIRRAWWNVYKLWSMNKKICTIVGIYIYIGTLHRFTYACAIIAVPVWTAASNFRRETMTMFIYLSLNMPNWQLHNISSKHILILHRNVKLKYRYKHL